MTAPAPRSADHPNHKLYDTVTITAACPVCGRDARWRGRYTTAGCGTTWAQIVCPHCG